MSEDTNTELPNDHDDYKRALEVIAEASNVVVKDLGERAVSEAVGITFDAAVNHPTHPERRPYMELGIRSAERPKRPNDMAITDLTPGTRAVLYNDKLTDKQKYAKDEVVLSEPYTAVNSEGEEFLAVDARRVENHATDTIPLDSNEGKRVVALSSWGLVPMDDGHNPVGYNTMRYIEPYVAETAATSAK